MDPMSNLMRIPPTESRVATATKNAVAGGVVVVIAVLAISFLIHAVEALVITAAAILAIGWVVWMLLFRKGR
jgi:hypothetical protein